MSGYNKTTSWYCHAELKASYYISVSPALLTRVIAFRVVIEKIWMWTDGLLIKFDTDGRERLPEDLTKPARVHESEGHCFPEEIQVRQLIFIIRLQNHPQTLYMSMKM